MAAAALKSLRFLAEAPAGEKTGRRAKLKPTNHMRPPGGGAFSLPSDGWDFPTEPNGTQMHAKTR
jgi:hypothetical protein